MSRCVKLGVGLVPLLEIFKIVHLSESVKVVTLAVAGGITLESAETVEIVLGYGCMENMQQAGIPGERGPVLLGFDKQN